MRIDGVDSERIDMRAFRKKIGFARQSAVLFKGTILDNLTNFRGREALPPTLGVTHELGLDNVIARMPDGLKTTVGDTATDSLAGSITQLITLVRAFGDSPRLLLFDEANSALDLDLDRKLRALIENLRGKTTLILVTNNPSLIDLADSEVNLDRGRIVAVHRRRMPVTPSEAGTAGGELSATEMRA